MDLRFGVVSFYLELKFMWLSRRNAVSLLEQLRNQEDSVCLQFTINGPPAGRKCSVLFRA